MLTDLFGTVILANKEAVLLLEVPDAYWLTHKPLANLVPLGQRQKFRKELSPVTLAEHVVAWRFTIARRADTPIEVSAAVQIVAGLGGDGGNALHWCLRCVAPDASPTATPLTDSDMTKTAFVGASADRAD